MSAHPHLVRQLFRDWVKAEASLIYSYSGQMTLEIRELIVAARERAIEMGLVWNEDLISEGMWDVASEYEEERWVLPERLLDSSLTTKVGSPS